MSAQNIGARDGVSIGSSTWAGTRVARGVLLGTAGSMTFTMEDESALTTDALAVGVIHPIRFTAITANSADGVVVFF